MTEKKDGKAAPGPNYITVGRNLAMELVRVTEVYLCVSCPAAPYHSWHHYASYCLPPFCLHSFLQDERYQEQSEESVQRPSSALRELHETQAAALAGGSWLGKVCITPKAIV